MIQTWTPGFTQPATHPASNAVVYVLPFALALTAIALSAVTAVKLEDCWLKLGYNCLKR